MNPNQLQQSQPQTQTTTPPSSPNDPTQKANQAAASLAFATHLQTQMLQHQAPQQSQNAPQTPETAPKTSEDTKTEEDTKQPDLAKELSSFKIEIEGMIKSQIGDLKREIQTALQEEPNEETKA